ncbi:Putative 2-amino-3-carboxymuconate-6-semialdehyde decarboxylase, metal-dependent hydrolase [Septoria linicola]|uniref:2-amino-3-carboxymuconate-6-semialdehyde decarboxylase, metal-dependent hydrolase n=1 Tax=Septoria linicola TaxID=215465 RepID=A0A9Q9EH13_9PEZI|nr:Putative 2-amino-3-carboxymuconate-6-semialdehyde decarboxylase, metal-dependent hydrolase [Septoria linicola]
MQQILRNANISQLEDLSTERLAAMDAGHVSMQVLSHVDVGDTLPSAVREANNQLAAVVEAQPSRFRAFAILPMAHPQEAANELERAVLELGAVGALIGNNLENGTTYDDERFWPVFAMAERLDVPIYLHPGTPSAERFQSDYQGNYDPGVAIRIGTAAWGWHANTGLHIVKLFAAGVFENFPNLKIILGHDGELLPIFIDRIERLGLRGNTGFVEEVWNRNIWITIGGMFSVRALEMVLEVTPIERICYAVDYPFVSPTAGWSFMEELAMSGLLSQHEMDLFAYGNAQTLLGIATLR